MNKKNMKSELSSRSQRASTNVYVSSVVSVSTRNEASFFTVFQTHIILLFLNTCYSWEWEGVGETDSEFEFRRSSIKPPSSLRADSLPNMNPYQPETAENTPEIPIVCRRVKPFCIFLYRIDMNVFFSGKIKFLLLSAEYEQFWGFRNWV